jgi:hypothetical protein
MAGELFEVFGTGRYGIEDAPECPKELEGKKIMLKATDGTLEVEAEAAFLSRKVAAVIAASPDAEVPVPVTLKTLEKVVEYMKLHVNTPPSDIALPLKSPNLVDCGASKADAALVKGDKDVLFDLMYASLAMAIPGLAYLTSAQMATMTQEKEASKIRKDFGLSNDIGEEETEQLSGAYNGVLAKKHLKSEDGSLMASAAVMSGLHLAAERNGGLSGGPAAVDLKSARYMCWRAVVLEEPYHLLMAPFEVKADREVAFATIKATQGNILQFVAEELKSDKEIVLAAVKASGGKALAFAASSLRSDKAFVQEAMAVSGEALGGASDALRGDRAFILEACGKGYGSCLKGASDALKGDAVFVTDCVAKDPKAVAGAGATLLTKEFMVGAAKASGKALEFMPATFKADLEVVGAAATSDTTSISYAHVARQADFVGPKMATMVQTDMKANMGGLRHLGVPLNDIDHTAQFSFDIVQKYVMFTALSTMTPNMGQSNYIAANAFLDKVPSFERPERDCIAMSWGTVGGMGMRYKAFGSQDFMNMTPDLLLSIEDCCKILCVVTTRMGAPEWMGANLFDENTRWTMLQPTTSAGSEDATVFTTSPPAKQPLAKEASRREEEEGEADEKQPERVPLGGWAMLAGTQATAVPSSVEPFEGARVRLTGLNSKENFTGTILKVYEEGKCRVNLDGEKGNALVKSTNLQVIA